MTLTQALIALIFLVTTLYTAYAGTFGQLTVSAALRDLCWNYGSFAYTWGVLVAHWMFTRATAGKELAVCAVVGFTLLGYDLLKARLGAPDVTPGVLFAVGVFTGWVFWAQAR